MIEFHHGDNREVLRRMIAEGVRVQSVVCDPPYGLVSVAKRFGKGNAAPAKFGTDGAFQRSSGGFMGQQWDASGIERDPEFWRLIHDILLPGGYCLAFSSPRTGHRMACAMEDAGLVMHPFLGWTYGCLDPKTECLTRRGWLSYTDLTDADEVCQWDSESDQLSWVKPTAVHEYPFDGDLVTIENRHTRQALTQNHRVYAKVRRHSRHPKATAFEVLTAEEIYSRPGNWAVDLPMAAPLNEGVEVDLEYAYLVGWWLTDAWAHRDANACMFSQCKPDTLARLRAALDPHGASEYVKSSRNDAHRDEHTFYLTGPLADRLRSEFPNRLLPWSVLSWSIDARRRLYEGLMDGDGSREKAGQYAEAFWSQNQERRDVFVALALSLGIRAYEDHRKGVVYVNPMRSSTQVQSRHRSGKLRHVGNVWCLTVPTGAFVVRREGRPFITGNSGFPKAHDAAKAITAQQRTGGASPQNMRQVRMGEDYEPTGQEDYRTGRAFSAEIANDDRPTELTAAAAAWDGWKYGAQSMKPALEPIYVAQRPFDQKNGALNILTHGVGALNIDGCRVAAPGEEISNHSQGADAAKHKGIYGEYAGIDTHQTSGQALGRHPANLLHDGSPEVVAMFPNAPGQIASSSSSESRKNQNCYGEMKRGSPDAVMHPRDDSRSSAARFFNSFPLDADPLFYCRKASKVDRAGSKHPTVKPIALMRWCCRLVTPPGGTVLDPFAGSGTTGAAALAEGFNCVLIEANDEYAADIRRRFGLDDDFDLMELIG